MKKILPVLVFALVDIVCFLQGAVILTYSLLHFSYKVEVVGGENLPLQELPHSSVALGGYYYYSDQHIKVALIGVALITTGILMRNWRKNF